MLDAVELEGLGVPTVTVATDWFVKAAHIQASMVGIPDLRVVGMEYVGRKGQGHWMSREERTEMLGRYWDELIESLVAGEGSRDD